MQDLLRDAAFLSSPAERSEGKGIQVVREARLRGLDRSHADATRSLGAARASPGMTSGDCRHLSRRVGKGTGAPDFNGLQARAVMSGTRDTGALRHDFLGMP